MQGKSLLMHAIWRWSSTRFYNHTVLMVPGISPDLVSTQFVLAMWVSRAVTKLDL